MKITIVTTNAYPLPAGFGISSLGINIIHPDISGFNLVGLRREVLSVVLLDGFSKEDLTARNPQLVDVLSRTLLTMGGQFIECKTLDQVLLERGVKECDYCNGNGEYMGKDGIVIMCSCDGGYIKLTEERKS